MEEIRKRILDIIEPPGSWGFSFFKKSDSKPYIGEASYEKFEIYRNINYRNSFLPVIAGHMSNQFGQTLVKIKLRLHIAGVLFLFAWLGISGSMCLFVLRGGSMSDKRVIPWDFPLGNVFPFILFMFGWLVPLIAFKWESSIAKKFLASLLEAQETSE